jgi:hypothetical protein
MRHPLTLEQWRMPRLIKDLQICHATAALYAVLTLMINDKIPGSLSCCHGAVSFDRPVVTVALTARVQRFNPRHGQLSS